MGNGDVYMTYHISFPPSPITPNFSGERRR